MADAAALIALADDHPIVRAALRAALASLGSDTRFLEASDAASTLAMVSSEPDIDLLLMDLHMPGVDGMDVYQHVLERCPALLPGFVFLTGGALTTRAREPKPALHTVRSVMAEIPFKNSRQWPKFSGSE